MKKIIVALGIVLPTSVFAGGFERNDQVPNFLFNDGRYAEFGLNLVNPEVEGKLPTGQADLETGEMITSYNNISLAYKAPINENLDWGFSYTEPYGAGVSYSHTNPFHPYNGTSADLDARSIAGLLRYKMGDNFSVYGGAKVQQFEADASVSVSRVINGALVKALDYDGDSDPDIAAGYLIGAAYEMKEIGLRVALTYNSEVEHTNDVVENATALDPNSGQFVTLTDVSSEVSTTLPSTINLAFQSGINEKTLVFGSIHWAEWTKTEIVPTVYTQVTNGQKLVKHDDDTTTYKLGLARRLNENVALAVIFATEEATDKVSTNLSPTDGYKSVTFAGTFSEGNSKVTAGISFIDVGDTFTEVGDLESDFSSNSALGFGVTYGYTF